jgi:hypothetical protein
MEVRRFKAGDALTYSYLVYGTKRNRASNLVSQIRVFQGDKEVFTNGGQPVVAINDANNEPLLAQGSLKLGAQLQPGEYFMQIVVTDRTASADRRTSEQWIDFEIEASGK